MTDRPVLKRGDHVTYGPGEVALELMDVRGGFVYLRPLAGGTELEVPRNQVHLADEAA
ncbi:hypothetical protein [Kitasatospora sp. NPDC059673]|uniref:hypothetical protein n=1 Tax=Kitasatospora sp. NPDC059673 TaxID=3346901 RepID=UPI003691A175